MSRHEPEGFAEDMEHLISLQRRRSELSAEIDEVFLRLVVDKRASITSVAKSLKVSVPVVSKRRASALRRQQERNQPPAAA